MLAHAQVQRTSDYLSKMDADRDGRVSLGEYQDWLGYAFDAMDRDRDGVLSPAEQPGGRGASLTRAEHRARLAERFGKQDANRDGFLSARELAAPPQ
jgi:Ca2+-binding EF-hand superfamily protein